MPSIAEMLAGIVAGASITTSVFLFAYFLGKLRGDLDRTQKDVAAQGLTLTSHGNRIEETEEHVRDILNDRRRVS